MQRVALIDNYDSFTFNLVHYLGELGADVTVWRNDEISVEETLGAERPTRSCSRRVPARRTRRASVSISCARRARRRRSSASASAIRRSGRRSAARSCARPSRCTARSRASSTMRRGIFRGLNGPFQATRYHSLVIERSTAPDELEVSAETDDGLIMAVAHRDRPVYGVQFHPESIASEHGRRILRNFLDLAAAFQARGRRTRRVAAHGILQASDRQGRRRGGAEPGRRPRRRSTRCCRAK